MVGWELRVLAVRLQGMGLGDARRGVMGYYDLARDARSTLTKLKKRKVAGEEVDAEIELWEGRLADLGIRVASALIEMGDLVGAGMHLKSLKVNEEGDEVLRAKKALLWLCLGDIDAARQCLKKGNGKEFLATEIDGTIRALAFVAEGRYEEAVVIWEELIANTATKAGKGEKAMWRQNLGVTLFYLGRGDEVRIISLFSMVPYRHNPIHFFQYRSGHVILTI